MTVWLEGRPLISNLLLVFLVEKNHQILLELDGKGDTSTNLRQETHLAKSALL